MLNYIEPGVNVMITTIGDFDQFSLKNGDFFENAILSLIKKHNIDPGSDLSTSPNETRL
jgi:hypothetical protein